jgi:hypothetical protein
MRFKYTTHYNIIAQVQIVMEYRYIVQVHNKPQNR